jgi:small subunit ribosomal protein S16
MVRIRLTRRGLRNQPSYRIVVADKESPRDGKFLEIVGNYNPRTNPFTLDVKEERIYHWLNNGAQPSESLMKLFKSVGLAERYERLKKGEAMDVLLAEAAAANQGRNASAKTRSDQ